MIILDTNVIAALMRAEPDAAARSWLDRQAKDEVWTTAICVFETRAGLEVLPAGRRRQRLERTFEAVLAEDFENRVLAFDRAAAEAAGVLLARLQRIGRPVELRDTQIAGIAVANRARLATFNVRHFEDLEIELIVPRR